MKNRYSFDRRRLQKYLPQLRACAGFSAEVLAQKVGVTKQAISLMEKHIDKPITKMQYICIRAVFDNEILKNPDNLNLRDCYDLVFSDPAFYRENISRIEYAIYQTVEDTKKQKKKNRMDAKKDAVGSGNLDVLKLVGTTIATVAVGGVAAATFPMFFSPVLGSMIVSTAVKTAVVKAGKKNDMMRKNIEKMNEPKRQKGDDEAEQLDAHNPSEKSDSFRADELQENAERNRASSDIGHAEWLQQAFEYVAEEE